MVWTHHNVSVRHIQSADFCPCIFIAFGSEGISLTNCRSYKGALKSLLRYPRSVGRWPDVRVEDLGLE